MRRVGTPWALAVLALAWVCGCGGGGGGADAGGGGGGGTPPGDSAARLEADVRSLSEDLGPRTVSRYANLAAAADYIEAQLEAAGCVVVRQAYRAGGRDVWNIVGDLPGGASGAPLVVVGAHYDSVDESPGADDNASGVAVLLETARRLAGQTTSNPVRFVAFATEEDPWFGTGSMGSQVFAQALRVEGEDLRAVLVLDMAGYFTGSARYGMAGALGTASQALLGEVEALFRSGTSMSLQRITGANSGLVDTDAASFWDEGFEAVVLSSPGWDLDEAWHTAADTWDRLDYPRMADLTDGVAAAVRGL